VGLPARGKTFLARKIVRYLSWLGIKSIVFNVGNYRRLLVGAEKKADFFDPENAKGASLRREAAMQCLDDLFKWLHTEGGQVAVYDATNSTKDRRDEIRKRCGENGVDVIYVETLCTDQQQIAFNVRETKLFSPDYKNMSAEEAIQDFKKRIAQYEKAYETLEDDQLSYLKLINVGPERKIIINRPTVSIMARLASYAMNLHIQRRVIYLTRHGESEANRTGKIGLDTDLSADGVLYSVALAAFLGKHFSRDADVKVWTSTMRRTIQTASRLSWDRVAWKALDEIDAGRCDGMSYEEIEQRMPEEFSMRKADKLTYRYPRGESYQDVMIRLEPILLEMERVTQPLVIVAHQAILRVLYGYLKDIPPTEVPNIEIPLHCVIELVPKTYGVEEQRHPLMIEPKLGSSPYS
jgi:broad specificity phosphatase PhoE